MPQDRIQQRAGKSSRCVEKLCRSSRSRSRSLRPNERAGAKTMRRKDLATSEASTWCANHKSKGSTRHADRSIKTSMSAPRSAHCPRGTWPKQRWLQKSRSADRCSESFGGRRPEAEAGHMKHVRIRTLVNPLGDSSPQRERT